MGLCVSKTAVIIRQDSEGYMIESTIINPTPEEKKIAKLQKTILHQAIGKQGAKDLIQGKEMVCRGSFQLT